MDLFKVFRRLNNLDKYKLAGCSGAVNKASNDVLYIWYLVCNTNISGLEYNSTVRYKVFAA